jgi:hypothetical protein
MFIYCGHESSADNCIEAELADPGKCVFLNHSKTVMADLNPIQGMDV